MRAAAVEPTTLQDSCKFTLLVSSASMSDVLTRLTDALQDRYRVSKEIGAGGMATVYLAHDLRHERDVAIKVLHPDLAAALGAERFLAEIKTTAKLQHPHILPLLDSGEAGGLLFYVMPYVAGESLRRRLERETQLPVDDAVRIAREVASALESAHKHGVVHRDIKPENILIHEDQALVADFGIALAVSAAGGARMTQTGLSLGTPAYMAPEQAMGERAIDARADIYALGAVLYEMLVGEAPFTGPTVQAIVARVMTESPRPVTGQRRSVPPHVNAAVLKALQKLPADRFTTASQFGAALASAGSLSDSAAMASDVSEAAVSGNPVWRRQWVPWAVAAVMAGVAAFFAMNGALSSRESGPVYVAVDMPAGMTVTPLSTEVLGISEDGQTLAIGATVNGRPQIVLRNLGEDVFKIVEGSASSIGSAAFSKDGQWLAFNAIGKIYKIALAGGPPTAIGSSNWAHMAWVGNDAIIYTKNYNSGLDRMSSAGRDTLTLTRPDRTKGELGHWWPQVLPDGDHVLFTNYTTPPDRSKIEVLSLKSGERRVVLEGGYFGRYVSGHLVFVRNGAVASIPFDAGSLTAGTTLVAVPLEIETNGTNGWAGFAIAQNGTLAYRSDVLKRNALVWTDEGGNDDVAIDSLARYSGAAPSPDGTRIAVVRDGDVWVYNRQRKFFSRLTQSEQIERDITWSSDSRAVLYTRDVPQFDIFRRVADGSKAEELIATSDHDKVDLNVSPDGRTLFFASDPDGRNRIFTIALTPGARQSPILVIEAGGAQDEPRASPDGLWFTYTSTESGRPEVFLSPYPVDRGPQRQQLSDGGGSNPHWGADGRTIYYNGADKIVRIRFNPRTGDVGAPEPLTRVDPGMGWATAPDGRFLVMRMGKGAERRSVNVVLNWASTLSGSAKQ